jgi:hypothetical protein
LPVVHTRQPTVGVVAHKKSSLVLQRYDLFGGPTVVFGQLRYSHGHRFKAKAVGLSRAEEFLANMWAKITPNR